MNSQSVSASACLRCLDGRQGRRSNSDFTMGYFGLFLNSLDCEDFSPPFMGFTTFLPLTSPSTFSLLSAILQCEVHEKHWELD